jgi:folate-binding protein YgfZ
VLHRISSNALLDLGRGTARPTLFCDFRGRLLHRAIVYRARDSSVWMLRPDAPGDELAAFLDRNVFRDDVVIEDRSGACVVERVKCPVGREPQEEDAMPSHVGLEDSETLAVRAHGTAPGADREDERDRILAGRPAHGREIAIEFNPFEVALGDEVHLDKGCYTGQEALQRLITYGSVRRHLALVRGTGQPQAPSDVTSRGERVGRLTSATSDGTSGRWVGLAVIANRVASDERIEVEAAAIESQQAFETPRPLGRP